MKSKIQKYFKNVVKGEIPEGYIKTKCGIVPEEWEINKLGNYTIDLRSGLSRKLSDTDIGVPVIRSNNIINNRIDFSDIKYWYANDPQGSNTENYFLKDGDILVNFINSLSQIGKAAMFKNNINRNVIFTTNILKMTLNEKLNSNYFMYFSETEKYTSYINSITKPAVNQASFTTVEFKKMELAIPPLLEQQKIANILSTWDKAIDLKEQFIEAKKQQKKGLMKKLLTGKVRLPGFKGEWQYVQARKLFQNITDKKHNGCGNVLSANQERGIILRSEGNIDIKYDENNLKNYKKVRPGEFVISLRSFQGGIEYSEYEGLLSPAYTIIRNVVPINGAFYKHFFKSTDFITRLNGLIYGIRDGKQISFTDFSILKLPYTTLEEQTAIGNLLETALKEINMHEKYLEALKLQKKGLMQLLLTGIIRVNS